MIKWLYGEWICFIDFKQSALTKPSLGSDALFVLWLLLSVMPVILLPILVLRIIICHDKKFWRSKWKFKSLLTDCKVLSDSIKFHREKDLKKNIHCYIVMWAGTLPLILSLLVWHLMLVNSSSDNTSVSSNLLSQAWIKKRKNSDRFYYVKWYEYQVMVHHSGRVFNFCRQLMKRGNTKMKASTKCKVDCGLPAFIVPIRICHACVVRGLNKKLQ